MSTSVEPNIPPHVLNYDYVSRLQENSRDPLDSANSIEPGNSLLTLETHQAILDKVKNDDNTYATSKSTSQGLLNLSVIQSQISLLVSVIAAPISGWTRALFVLLSLSLSLQIVIFVLLTILAKSKMEAIGKYTATGINALVTALSGILVITTTAITVVSNSAPRNITLDS